MQLTHSNSLAFYGIYLFCGVLIIYFDKAKTLFYIEWCSLYKLDLAYKKGKVKRVWVDSWEEDDNEGLAKILGFFIYQDDEQVWNAPYQRNYVPANPTNIESIPEPIKSNLSTVVFKNLKFKDYERLQPPQHIESYSWSFTWIDYEGKERLFEDSRYGRAENAEWFATDENDCIAIFLTGNYGATPVGLLEKFGSSEKLFDNIEDSYKEDWVYLSRDKATDNTKLIREGAIEKSESLEGILQNAEAFGDDELTRALIVADSQRVLKKLEPKGNVICFEPYDIVYIEKCPLAKFEKVYRQGRIKGIVSSYSNVNKGSEQSKGLPEFLGFFVYRLNFSHDDMNYELIYSPPIPTKLENVSEFLRPRLSAVSFTEIKFEDYAMLNVSEHEFIVNF